MNETDEITAYTLTYLLLLLVVRILTPHLTEDGVPILIVPLLSELRWRFASSQR